MNLERSSAPPGEPLNVSEPHPLSPASPKPIHLPASTTIPVLEMQMDVGFNQTEIHMSDPAMHNTEVRANFWRDPNEVHEEKQQENNGSSTLIANDEQSDAQQDIDETMMDTSKSADSADAHASNQAPISSIISSQFSPDSTSDALEGKNALSSVPKYLTTFPAGTVASPIEPITNGQEASPSIATNVVPNAQEPPAVQSISTTDVPRSSNEAHVHLTPGQTQSVQGLDAENKLNPAGGVPIILDPSETTAKDQPAALLGYGSPQTLQPDSLPPINAITSTDVTTENLTPTTDEKLRIHASIEAIPPTASTPSSLGQASVSKPTSNAVYSTPHSPSGLVPTTQDTTQANTRTTNTPIESRRETKIAAGQTLTEDDRPWDADIQRKYDRFIEDERKYVSEGRWEQFAFGSRLFVGNLSSEKVTKRDIFHIFHHYGGLAQISIKQAYGFVQFLNPDDCAKALNAEQGTQIRDKRIHLEVSKPQKGRGPDKNKDRRSRSPDSRRGAKGTVDRYVSAGSPQTSRGRRDSNHRRSPTPPRYRNRYDDKYRDRSPDTYGRNRYRSPSPRRDTDDDLPLPRRAPRDVPDVQILVLDNLERDFISWVENAFSSKGVRVDVLLLSPRLSEQAVVRRQIVEGVIAVSKLVRRNRDTGKIGLQIFDRSAGANNVKFEEYDHLDPPICAELVLRAKKSQGPPSYGKDYGVGQYSNAPAPTQDYSRYNAPATSYSQPGYGSNTFAPPPNLPVPPTNSQIPPPNIQHLISSLDPNGLQNLLSAMNRQQGSGAPPPSQGFPSAPPGYGTQQQSAALAALQQNPQALAGLLQQPPPFPNAPSSQGPAGNPGSVNMQDILARLGTYKP